MSKVAIKAENISKAYRLGQIGTGTISRDLERWWAKTRGKEDPFLKIGEANDRTVKGNSDVVWSLKDINFEINQGDAVGIIGRNGAGKSTLLKILSKVTSPTTGQITGVGRIASLLEVGTGFHPELTGRENIYLNGAILGMRKAEIKRKFDEIVDFSGVERYIDTPVKRYSSGMYVRLAFAVAAHLESEILIVDEVLAVGDAEFQKKCLGKMGEVAQGEGRTVLFVSHNMAAVKQLCSQGILLKNGNLLYQGTAANTVDKYVELSLSSERLKKSGNRKVDIVSAKLCSLKGEPITDIFMRDDIVIDLQVQFHERYRNLDIGINIKNSFDEIYTHITNLDEQFYISGEEGDVFNYQVIIRDVNFTPSTYFVDLGIVDGPEKLCIIESGLSFNVLKSEFIYRPGEMPGHVKTFLKSNWSVC